MKSPVFFSLGLALAAQPLRAWDNATAHPQINLEAVNQFIATSQATPKYQRAALNLKAVYPAEVVVASGALLSVNSSFANNIEGTRELTFPGIIVHGGFSADTPMEQAARHFYDPVAADGVSYLTDFYKKIGNVTWNPMDAKTWATSDPDNPWRWEAGLLAYKRAMEDGDYAQQAKDLAVAFRCLGETMHLMADMTLPAHVRNDGHPPVPVITDNDPIEMNVGIELVKEFAHGPVDANVSLRGGNPELLMHNVAAFTNGSFFSKDTIADAAYGLLPHNGRPPYAQPTLTDLNWDEKHLVGSRKFTAGTVRMVHQSLASYLARKLSPQEDDYYEIPDRYARDYAMVLVPIAVAANVKLLDLFFPKIDLAMTGTAEESGGKTNLRVSGKMIHDVTGDLVWAGKEIKYRGLGWVMRKNNRGGEDEPLTAVNFENGEGVASELIPWERIDRRTIYLQVEAGGRTFTSLPLSYGVTVDPPATQGRLGDEIKFTPQAVSWPNMIRCRWSFSDDRTEVIKTQGEPVSHKFQREGRHQVNLVVVDTENGSTVGTASASVTILASHGMVNIQLSAQTAAPGESVYFTPLVTNPNVPVEVYWSFGDNSPTMKVTHLNEVSHRYAKEGQYGVSLNVTIWSKGNQSEYTEAPSDPRWVSIGNGSAVVTILQVSSVKDSSESRDSKLPKPPEAKTAADIDRINAWRKQCLDLLNPDTDPARLANKAAALAAADAIHANGEKFVCKNCKIEVEHWWTNGNQWQCPRCELCTFITDLRRADGKTYGEFAQERVLAIQNERKKIDDEANALITKLLNQR